MRLATWNARALLQYYTGAKAAPPQLPYLRQIHLQPMARATQGFHADRIQLEDVVSRACPNAVVHASSCAVDQGGDIVQEVLLRYLLDRPSTGPRPAARQSPSQEGPYRSVDV
eukprot:7652850-Pyramimonas_sp.AAC.1